MTEVSHIETEGETPVNPYSLLEAVNRSSDTAHTAWLIFLGIMAYLMIAVAGVTHRDLLLERAVQLPILGVPIPLVQFFQFAPIFLLLFHLGLISQLVLLARKTLEFDISVRQLEPTSRRTHPLRLELHNFFFVQGVAGPHRSAIMSLFLHSMSWLTLAILPVVLLLFIQISFLAYHDAVITWTHRIALLLDIGVLVLIGVFLMRAETNFFQAFWRTGISHPFSFLITFIVLSFAALFSFVVATIPGEGLDIAVRKFFKVDQKQKTASGGAYLQGFSVPFLWGSSDGSLFGFFHRNLIVTDIDLVIDKEVTLGERSISLRGRDLRFAELDRSDLHQADMTGVDLEGASLVGTDLRRVRLNCQDETELLLGEGREKAECASARNANFTGAKLNGAQMTGI
ncbi:MAG: pentapeptide repeat-containing protein, partial [Hyphomicrobiaceae bacterium]